MMAILFVVFALIFAIIIMTTGGDLDKLTNEVQRLLSVAYPKFGNTFNSTIGSTSFQSQGVIPNASNEF